MVEEELEIAIEKNGKLRQCCKDLLIVIQEKGISPSLRYSLTELEISI